MYASTMPTYGYSVSSDHPMLPFDLNEEDQSNHHQLSSSSSSSPSYHTLLFNPDRDQPAAGSNYYWEEQEAEKIVPSSGSCENNYSRGLKLRINWKKEEDGDYENLQADKFEEAKQPLSPPATDDNSNDSSNHMMTNNIITVRVCSDCHTTKTPLWRSGPRGPKSLCNACGIRQRKARRAMAAAAEVASPATASANGAALMMAPAGDASHHDMKGKKLHINKEKKKLKLAKPMKPWSRGRKKKFGNFEDMRISLSKSLNDLQVFPQDEKEAAILLMALSYGLLHGFPSDRYLDL